MSVPRGSNVVVFPTPEPYLSRLEIARLMGVSPRTIDRWCKEGLPHQTWGLRTKKLRFSEVEEWARKRGAA
jgi:excisionase family DNA binding protein